MERIVDDSYEAMSRRAAERIVTALRQQGDLLLAAASGGTPTHTYQLLAETRQREPRLFERLRIVKLDEWGGLEGEDPASCEAYLRKRLIDPLGVTEDRYLRFATTPEDPHAECHRIRGELDRHGPIDVCLLGLGQNGHLGFNEPGEWLQPFAHVAQLTHSSLTHPMLADARGRVEYGLTLGMSDILCADQVLLLVAGPRKRRQVRRLFSRQISTHFPASLLWLHPRAVCLCDRAAVRDLNCEEQ